jgi:hypothetical protein
VLKFKRKFRRQRVKQVVVLYKKKKKMHFVFQEEEVFATGAACDTSCKCQSFMLLQ